MPRIDVMILYIVKKYECNMPCLNVNTEEGDNRFGFGLDTANRRYVAFQAWICSLERNRIDLIS